MLSALAPYLALGVASALLGLAVCRLAAPPHLYPPERRSDVGQTPTHTQREDI
jgi:hypothetical protein